MSNRTKKAVGRRAFSKIRVKKADSKSRIIEGVATTPTPDRMGDVIEPQGATFKLPLPLLWQHNSRQPVGLVTEAKVTDEGIAFKAHIESHDEPGPLKDRLDEAWHSVLKGLVGAVSIGFVATEPPEFMRNGGYRFSAWEWFELSLVTIPANAEATIDTIKRLRRKDLKELAASGRSRAACKPKTPPGVTGNRKTVTPGATHMPKFNAAERLEELETESKAHKTRMQAILAEAAEEEERELDADEQAEFDELEAKAADVDRKIRRLKAAFGNDNEPEDRRPRGVVRAVEPEDGRSPARAAASRGRETVPASVKAPDHPGLGFARLVKCFGAAKGDIRDAMEIARKWYPREEQILTVLKAQVPGAVTDDPSWAAPLVEPQNLVSEFIEYLRPQTILGKFGANGIPSLRRVPFNIKVPAQITGGTGYWVGEGRAKPLTRGDFTSLTLRFNKVANIAVLSEELLRHSTLSAELVIRDMLAGALLERLDADFVNPSITVDADVRPASITNGASNSAASGLDAAAVRADIRTMASFFIAANIPTASVVLIMRQWQALSLSLMRNALGQREFPDITMNGGTLEGWPVIASQHVPQGVVAAVCANEVYLADDGGIAIDLSREASLEMATDPSMLVADTASPPVPAETTVVSLWQTNSVGIRAERIITWLRRRSAAVYYLTSTGWGNADTSPPQAAI